MGRSFTPGARFAGILRLNFLDRFRGIRLARKDVRDDVWTCEIVSFGGGCWNRRIREGDGGTFPYRTGAKCPSSIHDRGAVDDFWAENMRRNSCRRIL